MKRKDFNELFDAETFHELTTQFNDLDIQKNKEQVEADEEMAYLLELSLALSEEGVEYFRDVIDINDEIVDIVYLRPRHKPGYSSLLLEELMFYRKDGVPAKALAAAFKAGLLSNAFKFWTEIEEDDGQDKEENDNQD